MRSFVFCVIILATMSFVNADTVRLKNGRSIDAQSVTTGGKVPAGKVRLQFSNGGWMLIDEADVLEVIKNQKDAFNSIRKES